MIYGYDAPDYYDFSQGLENEENDVDSYFEIEHESHNALNSTYDRIPIRIDDSERDIDQEFYTPMKDPRSVDEPPGMKKSLSMNDIREITRRKQFLKPANSTISLRQPTKPYVSMAEAVRSFHTRTPQRFRSVPKNRLNPTIAALQPVQVTVPQSPMLKTKERSRPVSVMSREEKEIRDFEEAKKYQIKAHPINRKILNSPSIINIPKRNPTIPQPFDLTKIQPKKPDTPEPTFQFHARPIPKFIQLTINPELKKPLIKDTKLAPKFMKKQPVKPETNGPVRPVKLEPTKPVPFSFLERDKDRVNKKEQLKNEIFEEEKRAREFHAQPLPKVLFKSPRLNKSSDLLKQRIETSILRTSNPELCTGFKARPAKVLNAKPFVPKKSVHALTEITQFNLNSEKRANARDGFEQHKREREMLIAETILQALQPVQMTVLQSLILKTKERSRLVIVMNREEKEIKDLEEAKKCQIKTHPINRKILNSPSYINISKRNPIPQPFDLTKIQPKKPETPEPTFQFHARPIPKFIQLTINPELKKPLIKDTKLAPKFIKKQPIKPEMNGPVRPVKLESTKPVPFSFLERDKDRVNKKEQLKNEIFEEEKRAREFHAPPLPKVLFKSPRLNKSSDLLKQRIETSNLRTSNPELCTGFKARPVKVLNAKPFVPKKSVHALTEITQFNLNSEKRANARDGFEQHKREREMLIAETILQNQMIEKLEEEEEIRKLRKETVHKANPIRLYKEVRALPKKKLTDPISPTFVKQGNKENSIN